MGGSRLTGLLLRETLTSAPGGQLTDGIILPRLFMGVSSMQEKIKAGEQFSFSVWGKSAEWALRY